MYSFFSLSFPDRRISSFVNDQRSRNIFQRARSIRSLRPLRKFSRRSNRYRLLISIERRYANRGNEINGFGKAVSVRGIALEEYRPTDIRNFNRKGFVLFTISIFAVFRPRPRRGINTNFCFATSVLFCLPPS